MPLMSRFCTSTTPPGIGTNISDRMNAPLVRKCCHELGCSVRARYSTARSSLPQMPGQTMSRMTRFTARYGSVQATHRRANLSPARSFCTSVTAPFTSPNASTRNSAL